MHQILVFFRRLAGIVEGEGVEEYPATAPELFVGQWLPPLRLLLSERVGLALLIFLKDLLGCPPSPDSVLVLEGERSPLKTGHYKAQEEYYYGWSNQLHLVLLNQNINFNSNETYLGIVEHIFTFPNIFLMEERLVDGSILQSFLFWNCLSTQLIEKIHRLFLDFRFCFCLLDNLVEVHVRKSFLQNFDFVLFGILTLFLHLRRS